jgi:hypothetical protein
MCIANCPGCKRRTKVTRHHILPKRFYGSPANAPILKLCRGCHNDLETLIPTLPKMPFHFYWNVIFIYLNTNKFQVFEWAGGRSYYARREEYDMQSLQTTAEQVLR